MNNPEPDFPVVHDIETAKGRLRVNDYPGDGGAPALVMLHGYPDDSRVYQRLIPHVKPRRVVTFDFLGYGRSGRGASWPLDAGQRESELAAVIENLSLERPVLVGHDASGPVVINYAIANPGRLSGIVLLNTYYADSAVRFPELIRLLADPHFTPLVDAVIAEPAILGWLLTYTDQLLREGPADPQGLGATSILPQFFGDKEQPDAVAAIRAWTAELFTDLELQKSHVAAGDLAALDIPVVLAFGEHDPCFTRDVGKRLQALLRNSRFHEIHGAAHWPMWDQPAATAAIMTGEAFHA
jgi:haloalkane dehalogenase